MLQLVGECMCVAKWSLKSRLALLLLQVLLHNVVPDHTGSMEDVFMKVHRSPEHPFLVERLLGGLDNWDAEYFIFNAHTGYSEHEQTMVFFPLLPMAMWTLSKTLFLPLSFLLPQRSVMLISGATLNLMAFPLATVALYLLTFELSRDKKLALLAAGLFSLNPASVFMSAVYSETFFALFTFCGLLALEKRHQWLSAMAFCLATFTRSNGVVLCGFLGYQCLWFVTETLFYQSYWSFRRKLQSCVRCVWMTALQCLVTVVPFCGFQLYGYIQYCRRPSIASTSLPDWCNHTLPLPYSYIQAQYWNVGFLKYYEFKQLPNFLLAAPMVTLVLLCAICYFTDRDVFVPPKAGSRMGRQRTSRNKTILDCSLQEASKSESNRTVRDRTQDTANRREQDRTHSRTERDRILATNRAAEDESVRVRALVNLCSTPRLRPYVFHILFLTSFGVLNMHIQVLTRFICSSSPLIYWFSAHILLRTHFSFGLVKHLNARIAKEMAWALFGRNVVVKGTLWMSRALVLYFALYILIGFTLHCNFYPWT